MAPSDSWTAQEENDDPVVVYRTRMLNEADVVAEAMGRAGMPIFRRVETIGGLSSAMPVDPPPGLLPGGFFAIAVPRSWATRAAHFIARLPVSQETEPRGAHPGAREFFQGWTWLFVVAILCALLWTIIRMYAG